MVLPDGSAKSLVTFINSMLKDTLLKMEIDMMHWYNTSNGIRSPLNCLSREK